MAVTSFIKPIDTNRGIFYTFKSAMNDFTRTIGKQFKFSKYALLRIPHMGMSNDIPTDNIVQFLGAGESVLSENIDDANYNVNLAESFQNYCLNLETNILNSDEYNNHTFSTVSERVFWKWLKEMGVVRFRETSGNVNDSEKDYDILPNEKRFVEKDEYDGNNKVYDRVVKYIGDVSMVNTNNNSDSYIEIYIHTPTNVGNIPYTLFKSRADDNYYNNMIITNNVNNPLDVKYLAGRHNNDTHPYGLNTKAFYDIGESSSVTSYIGNDLNTLPNTQGRWIENIIDYAYFTDSTFNDATEDIIRRVLNSNNNIYVNLIRNRLDGIELDFSINHYKLANSEPDIKTFTDFSSYYNSVDFDFNAILLYYDLVDLETEEVLSTNLYGVLFLNKVVKGGVDWYIPMIKKHIPDPTNGIYGNSFAHKFNIKMDAHTGDLPIITGVGDSNELSMDLYMDLLNASIDLNDRYLEGISYIQNVSNDINLLRSSMLDDVSKDVILSRLDFIEDNLKNNQSLFNNKDTIMNLISDLYNKIDKVNQNKITNITTPNLYNLSKNVEFDIIKNNIINLNKGANYIRITTIDYTKSDTYKLTDDIKLYINDNNSWDRGQIFDIVFDTNIDLNGHKIKFYTDVRNKMGNGKYGVNVYNVDMISNDNNTIIRIMCSDSIKYKFYIDKIN